MVLGVFLALCAAVLSSVREVFQKHLTSDFSSLKMAFMGQFWGALLVSPFAIWYLKDLQALITPWNGFSLLISASSVLITVYLLFEALRGEDLSIVSPLKNVSPVIVVVIEPLVLKTVLSPLQVVGAVLGTTGAYVLVASNGLSKPLKNLDNREAQMTLLIALIYAFSTVARKYGTGQIDTLTFSYFSWMLTLVGFAFFAVYKNEFPGFSEFIRKDVFVFGFVTVVSVFMGFFAISIISATEYTIVKQTTGIFSVLLGGGIFKEKNILRKLIGALMIIIGVAAAVI